MNKQNPHTSNLSQNSTRSSPASTQELNGHGDLAGEGNHENEWILFFFFVQTSDWLIDWLTDWLTVCFTPVGIPRSDDGNWTFWLELKLLRKQGPIVLHWACVGRSCKIDSAINKDARPNTYCAHSAFTRWIFLGKKRVHRGWCWFYC